MGSSLSLDYDTRWIVKIITIQTIKDITNMNEFGTWAIAYCKRVWFYCCRAVDLLKEDSSSLWFDQYRSFSSVVGTRMAIEVRIPLQGFIVLYRQQMRINRTKGPLS